ncbi:integral membrane sensor signal transduction histidine kinase [Alloactinosynnema sp. L-07]|uniref:sensor histidine kinase n=1 Tax=Alloactinosynnema sp. L-07 TaxID=1653480 RepID=UPI00065EF0CC|nr:ATP-binding protein [Alloactinosynnema sp. L-07]CRK57971.1 integral membrane sensor signal transduction histidine kinase [Alloactinosynnema sp. L-07]
MAARVEFRRRLLVRLLAGSVLIAACAIAATAWLAVRSTSGAIRAEQGSALATDAKIYDTLLGYAATHPKWDGVGQVVADLARDTGRVIVLTDNTRAPIAQSANATLPQTASAVVDPLAVDPALVPNAPSHRIDPRAVGPFALTPQERADVRSRAERAASCLREQGFTISLTEQPTGRTILTPIDAVDGVRSCGVPSLAKLTATEQNTLNALYDAVNACLTAANADPVMFKLDLSWLIEGALPMVPTTSRPAQPPSAAPRAPEVTVTAAPAPASANDVVSTCVNNSRRAMVLPYTSPAALLFITDPAGDTAAPTGLSTASALRIAATAAAVLLLAVGVTVLMATRLTRPIRALTEAAQRMRDGDSATRVTVRSKDEIGQLAAVFNELSAHREALERQRKDMVSDVSHELRAPLGNIRGWLEAAQDGVAETDPTFVASLLEESVVLQRLIDDLQDLALADAGKLRLHPRPVDVADLIDQVVATHRAQSDVDITAEVRAVPEIVADPVRLRQVLGNLVGNAVRYGGPDGQVTIRAVQRGDHVVIEVADAGPGIAPDDLPHVFNRFWRAEKSRSRQTGGSGLGLAVVRDLVELHDGTVTVASTLGEGTTFTVRLRLSGPRR